MQADWKLLIKGLIPELSEMEANGYNLDIVIKEIVGNNLSFSISATNEGRPTISYSGFYQAIGVVTKARFDRIVNDMETGVVESETASYTITRITKDKNLFEQWRYDADGDMIGRSAKIVANYDSANARIQMPLIGKEIKDITRTMTYKRFLKDKNKDGLRRLISSISEGTSEN